MEINDLNGRKFLKTNQIKLKKLSREKMISFTLNGEVMAILFGLIRKTWYKWVTIFLNQVFFLGGGGRGVKLELDLSN